MTTIQTIKSPGKSLQRSARATTRHVVLNLFLAVIAFEAGRLINPWTLTRETAAKDGGVPSSIFAASISGDTANLKKRPLSEGEAQNEDQLKSALDAIGGKPGSEETYDRMMKALLALAAVDPHAALDYALGRLKEPFREQALSEILGVWAKRDPKSAWSWIKTGRADDSVLTGAVLKEVGGSQPDLAWGFAAELAPQMPKEAAGFYVSAMDGMIDVGKYADAARLLGSAVLPATAAQSSYGLVGLLASEWGEYQPAQAAAWVLTLPEGSNAYRQAVIALGQSWATIDPPQALNFASQLPPSPERIAALTPAIDAWYASNPTQVSDWIAALPKGADYDQFAAAISVAPRIINSSPKTSVAWAMAISDNDLKMQSLTSVFSRWFEIGDVNAIAYLKQLPPDTKSNLLKRLKFTEPK